MLTKESVYYYYVNNENNVKQTRILINKGEEHKILFKMESFRCRDEPFSNLIIEENVVCCTGRNRYPHVTTDFQA